MADRKDGHYGFERLTLGGFTHGDSYQASVQHSEMDAPAVKPFLWAVTMKRMEISQDEIKKVLNYDPKTGIFKWLNSKSNKVAGSVSKTRGYIHIKIHGKSYSAHRLAWLYFYGSVPKQDIDHIDHCKTNNSIENLRVVDHKENHKNASKNKNNTSGFAGVSWSKKSNKWWATIKVSGKTYNLGVFEKIEDAVAARLNANKKYGFHENHGEASQCMRSAHAINKLH